MELLNEGRSFPVDTRLSHVPALVGVTWVNLEGTGAADIIFRVSLVPWFQEAEEGERNGLLDLLLLPGVASHIENTRSLKEDEQEEEELQRYYGFLLMI